VLDWGPGFGLAGRTLLGLLGWRAVSGTHSRPRRQGRQQIGVSEFLTGYSMGMSPLTLSFLESYPIRHTVMIIVRLLRVNLR
jgi:hypothetical protein